MNPRRMLIVVIAVAIVSAITASLQMTGRTVARSGSVALAQSVPEPGTIQFIWQGLVRDFRSAAFSPDDSYFAVVSKSNGTITLRKNTRDKIAVIWEVKAPGVTHTVVGPDGKTVIAFTAMDPTRQAVTFITDVHTQHRFILDGAIWDATISANGSTAGIVTGNHSLYIFSLDGAPRFQRRSLMGTGNSVAISKDGSFLASGTWNQSGVVCYKADGSQMWQYPEASADTKPVVNRLFEAQIATDSPYILGVSYANVQQSDATIYLWRKNRPKPLWTYPLGPEDSAPQTKICSNGSHVAVTYLHRIMHGDQSTQVRQLVMLDRYGDVMWGGAKGGLLIQPNLVAISPDGNTVTVSDAQNALYNFDADGRISAPSKAMPALIRSTTPSADGRYVLVYTGDGTLTLVRPV